jgi:thiamine-phosphate pyrophosphorylase
MVGVSCHSPAEVGRASDGGADFVVFGPVFGKKDTPIQPAGLGALKKASEAKIPVLALGGITLENAPSCLAAGASGIAAIRLFQDNDIASVVRALR